MRGGSVAVVGGSIAGCATALAASRGGAAKVTVFERAEAQLRDRGVGVTLHDDRYAELEAAGYLAHEMPWGQLERRTWVVRDGDAEFGRTLDTHPFPFRAYRWGSLWSELRRRVPEAADYRTGTSVSAVEPDADGVTLQLADGQRERFDVVIGADGYRSAVRKAMFPDLTAQYSGYVAWRGTSQDVEDLPADGTESQTVVFPGGHGMIYRMPDGAGGHLLNWVLYMIPPEELNLQVDLQIPTSLPPGQLNLALTDHFRAVVADNFPPYWAARVLRTPADRTFIQPIYDLEVPHYAGDRMLLVGDAASVARPHIGGGTIKALQDATVLERVWNSADSWQEAQDAYNLDRREIGASMVALSRRLGRAQVQDAPDWSAMTQAEHAAWWRGLHEGPQEKRGFGGVALSRA